MSRATKIFFAVILTLLCIRCCSVETSAATTNIIDRTVKLIPKQKEIVITLKESEYSMFSDEIEVLVSNEDRENILALADEHKADIECLAKIIWVEGGGESLEFQSAVAWTIFNHLDCGNWGSTLTDVITYPGHFAWDKYAPVNDLQLKLAKDIFMRWALEKAGYLDVGRTLPADFIYFWANSKGECRFNTAYGVKEGAWDWSLPSPYENWQKNN